VHKCMAYHGFLNMLEVVSSSIGNEKVIVTPLWQ
jgi:hypothetical protein